MRKLFIPLFIVCIFLFESLFVNIFIGEFYHGHLILVPRLLMIFFVFFTVFGNYRAAVIYSAVTGFVFDIVYTEVLGIYLFVLPIITYLISKLMKILHNNIFMVSVMSVVAVAMLEIIVYGFNFILGFANMSFQEFALVRLLPTLGLNAIIVILVAYPVRKFIVKYATEESNELHFRNRH
ncbi:rod shape-determining protein MreD [Bacillus massiliigorillae]|uniref:rod shape-determining protein MreD n=1 Tax=Bacillus massiliigorillae TaxID=1243664 RepID=UPI0003A8BB3F|nr:rod shape-determining protein MreD [Bacillus massiliigorillae]